MITMRDLDQAIAECQGERNPNASTCMKLAAFLTIKRELFGDSEQPPASAYSFAASPPATADTHSEIVDYDSGTDFARAIDGRRAEDIWPVMDELMSVLQATIPRLYDSVMRKLA